MNKPRDKYVTKILIRARKERRQESMNKQGELIKGGDQEKLLRKRY